MQYQQAARRRIPHGHARAQGCTIAHGDDAINQHGVMKWARCDILSPTHMHSSGRTQQAQGLPRVRSWTELTVRRAAGARGITRLICPAAASSCPAGGCPLPSASSGPTRPDQYAFAAAPQNAGLSPHSRSKSCARGLLTCSSRRFLMSESRSISFATCKRADSLGARFQRAQ